MFNVVWCDPNGLKRIEIPTMNRKFMKVKDEHQKTMYFMGFFRGRKYIAWFGRCVVRNIQIFECSKYVKVTTSNKNAKKPFVRVEELTYAHSATLNRDTRSTSSTWCSAIRWKVTSCVNISWKIFGPTKIVTISYKRNGKWLVWKKGAAGKLSTE